MTEMPIIILIYATFYVFLAGIYSYLPFLHLLYFLYPQQASQHVLALFLGEWPIPLFLSGPVFFVILPRLSGCSFPITSQDIIAPGDTVRISWTPDTVFLTSIVEKQSNVPLVIWINHPPQHCYFFLTCWFKSIRSPKCPEGSLNFQFNNVHSPICRIKTSRPTELKVIGTGSKNFSTGSVVVIAIRTILFSIP